MRKVIALLLLAIFCGSAQATIKVGMNVGPEIYNFTERGFLNIFKYGGGWTTQSGSSIDTSEEAFLYQSFLDSNGYPTTLTGGPAHTFDRVSSVFYQGPLYPSGRYVFMYDGTGTFQFTDDATVVSGAGTGRILLDMVATSTGFKIRLLTTGSPYAKNFRLVFAPTATASVIDPAETAVNASQQTVTGAANNGSGLIRLAVSNTSYWTTGDKLTVSTVGGTTEANGFWTITVIDGTHIDLQGSTFTNAYTSGGGVGDLSKAFDPNFITRITPFKSIRFLDWMGVIGNLIIDWSDRLPASWVFWDDHPAAATRYGVDPRTYLSSGASGSVGQNGDLAVGVPLDVEFALCNKIGADAWINIPYLATDTTVTNLANLSHAMLTSGLKINVEYGNENWAATTAGNTSTISNITASISGTTLTVTAITPTVNIYGVTQTVILGPNMGITGSGVTARTMITANGTGTGGLGTYTVNTSQTVGSETMGAEFNANTIISNLDLAIFPGASGFNDLSHRGQYSILRAVQAGHIFKTQWGADAANVIRVMGGQNANTGVAQYNLSTVPDGANDVGGGSLGGPSFWFGSTGGKAATQIDVVDVAPYVGQRYSIPNSFTAESDGGKTKLFTQMISGGLIPTGAGANTTAGTSTAFTLTTDAAWGNGALTEPIANETMIQFVLNTTAGTNPTLKADASSPHPLFDRFGNPATGFSPGTYVASYTTATSAGSVTAGWRIDDLPASSLQGMIYDEITCACGSETTNLAVATTYGVGLVAYEGAQGLDTIDSLLQTLYEAAQSDSRMGTVTTDLLTEWQSVGGGTFHYYEFTRQDGGGQFWGILTDASQTHSVKFDAVINFINGGGGGTHGGASWIGRLGMLDLKPANDNNPWLIKVAQ